MFVDRKAHEAPEGLTEAFSGCIRGAHGALDGAGEGSDHMMPATLGEGLSLDSRQWPRASAWLSLLTF